ncbi:YbjQ family protein [Rhizobium ruizarguesonis]|uniref:YbjQ family protein n=1 Tax=Rhizobium ruizarguesonis TaxID=2081791 RepID=UPI001FE0B588|nr:YbjQ family protein [Rhizobium ruizarguesonis]
MQLLCKECGHYKPENQVQLGTCDDCFKYGAPRQAKPATQTDERSTVPAVILTTSIDVPNRKIESVISIVAAEAALGMNILRDIANNWRDLVGGRANSAQKSLREARLACLDELKREAAAVGADAVIAIDLDYNELSTSGSGGGILFVAASGTAVKLAPI